MNFQKFIVASVLILISLPAEARRHHGTRCAYGQIYRVSLGVCQGRGRYARYEPAPKRSPRHQKPTMLQVVEPPQKAQDALLEQDQQPERSTKGDRCGNSAGVLLPNVPWYSAERSLMTIKPIGGFSWLHPIDR
jgi:hypothetical protein